MMDVKHDVSHDDRQPEKAEQALRDRQAKEDAETLNVRGPQRPADSQAAPKAADTYIAHPPTATAVPHGESHRVGATRTSYRRRDLHAEQSAEHVAHPAVNESKD